MGNYIQWEGKIGFPNSHKYQKLLSYFNSPKGIARTLGGTYFPVLLLPAVSVSVSLTLTYEKQQSSHSPHSFNPPLHTYLWYKVVRIWFIIQWIIDRH